MDHTLKDYALALQLIGAKVEVTGNTATAKNGRACIIFMISEEDGLFGWGGSKESAGVTVFTFRHIREALGLTGYVRPSTVLKRAMNSIGLTNRRQHPTYARDFHCFGEYNRSKERVRTFMTLDSQKGEHVAVEHWGELKGALAMTGYVFEMHDINGRHHYVVTA